MKIKKNINKSSLKSFFVDYLFHYIFIFLCVFSVVHPLAFSFYGYLNKSWSPFKTEIFISPLVMLILALSVGSILSYINLPIYISKNLEKLEKRLFWAEMLAIGLPILYLIILMTDLINIGNLIPLLITIYSSLFWNCKHQTIKKYSKELQKNAISSEYFG